MFYRLHNKVNTKLLSFLQKSHKKTFIKIMVYSILFSLIELIGISLIMPFVQIATDFDIIHTHAVYEKVYHLVGFHKEIYFVIVFGLMLILFYIVRALYNLFYYYTVSKFIRKIYYYLSTRLFRNYVGMDYRNFIEKNSAHLIQTITVEADNLSNLLHAYLLIFGEAFIIIIIYGMLLYVNWKLTLLITFFLAINVLIIVKTVSKKIKKAGEVRANEHRIFHEILNSTFGNFKMLKLQNDETNTVQRFEKSCESIIVSHITNETLQHLPRLFLEAMSFVLVIGMILYWIIEYNTDVSGMIGILTLFIVALYRLMPSFNRIVTNYNSIQFYTKSLELVQHDLEIVGEGIGDEDIGFERSIELKDISYAYEKDRKVLNSINFIIQKGQKIAFVGESGGGKSTLVDIIIGLLKPSSGEIVVDGVKIENKNLSSWRQKIGYIPQDVYLFDATVAENVAFLPRDEVDEKRVKEVLRQAEIYQFLTEHQEEIDTIVGEGGIKLSGGQKQRIAIARALYHNPEIIVMDEATSALDNETEKAIMKKIYEIGEGKTMIMIAHRLSTIEGCDVIYRVENGRIVK